MPNITTNHAITYIYLKIWVCFTLFSLGVLNNARQGSNQPIKVDAIVDSLKLEKTTKVSVDFFLAKFYSHFASKTNTVWHEIFVVLIFAIFPAIAKISSHEKKIKIKKILQTFFFKNLLQSKYSLSNLNSLHRNKV